MHLRLTNSTFLIFRFAPLLLLGASVGCGDSTGNATPVQGAVSFEGKPAPYGAVFFLKAGEEQKLGQIGSDGTYKAELPPGEYQVRIDTTPPLPPGHKEGDPIPPQPRPIPQQYANFATSGLTATVSEQSEPQQLDFALP